MNKMGAQQLPRGNQVFALKFLSFSAFPSYGCVKAEEIYSHSRGKRVGCGDGIGGAVFLEALPDLPLHGTGRIR